MSLDIDQVALMLFRWGSPVVAKPDVVERGRGLEARDMTAKLRRFFVGTKNDRDCVPANDGPNPMLDLAVPICVLFALRGDRINVRAIQSGGDGRTGVLRLVSQPVEQKSCALRAFVMQDGAQ